MPLIDKKIVVFANPVSSLPDHPSQSGMTAAQLKAAFDANATGEIKTSINGIVDDLVAVADGASGADNIGATAIKVGGATRVQVILEELQADKMGLIGNENIAGIKTFSSSPIIPAPGTNMNPATKKYVDDIAASSALGNATYLGGQLPAYYATAAQINTLDAEIDTHITKSMAYVIKIVRDVSVAGVQVVTLPFKAKALTLFSSADSTKMISNGLWAENNIQSCIYATSTGEHRLANSDAIVIATDPYILTVGDIQNVTDTGFEINWIKVGSPTSKTANVFILATTH